jgi:hypothetical protein
VDKEASFIRPITFWNLLGASQYDGQITTSPICGGNSLKKQFQL